MRSSIAGRTRCWACGSPRRQQCGRRDGWPSKPDRPTRRRLRAGWQPRRPRRTRSPCQREGWRQPVSQPARAVERCQMAAMARAVGWGAWQPRPDGTAGGLLWPQWPGGGTGQGRNQGVGSGFGRQKKAGGASAGQRGGWDTGWGSISSRRGHCEVRMQIPGRRNIHIWSWSKSGLGSKGVWGSIFDDNIKNTAISYVHTWVPVTTHFKNTETTRRGFEIQGFTLLGGCCLGPSHGLAHVEFPRICGPQRMSYSQSVDPSP